MCSLLPACGTVHARHPATGQSIRLRLDRHPAGVRQGVAAWATCLCVGRGQRTSGIPYADMAVTNAIFAATARSTAKQFSYQFACCGTGGDDTRTGVEVGVAAMTFQRWDQAGCRARAAAAVRLACSLLPLPANRKRGCRGRHKACVIEPIVAGRRAKHGMCHQRRAKKAWRQKFASHRMGMVSVAVLYIGIFYNAAVMAATAGSASTAGACVFTVPAAR